MASKTAAFALALAFVASASKHKFEPNHQSASAVITHLFTISRYQPGQQ